MEDNDTKCPYCGENMTYGPTKQIYYRAKYIPDNIVTYEKEIHIKYGWKCSMNTDDCNRDKKV